jgi:hypothetical protein
LKKKLTSLTLLLIGILLIANVLALMTTFVPNAKAEIVWMRIGEFCMDPNMPCLCPSNYDVCYCPVIIL